VTDVRTQQKIGSQNSLKHRGIEMKSWSVTLPVAGHAYVTVEAETEEEAIEKAFNNVTIDNLESWEAVERFNQGNVCYCPHPWEAEAIDEGEVEPE
jgi:hypothetical protein